MLDHAFTNMNGVSLLFTIAWAANWIFIIVPGGDVIIAALLATVFICLGTIVSYAMISATFPRSGAPYVSESRVLAPWIGWPAEVNMWLTVITWIPLVVSGVIIFTALIPGLYAMGISSGNPSLIDAANWLMADIRPTLIIGEVFLIGTMLIAISGTRRLVRTFQLPLTIIVFIVTALVLGLYATTSSAQFAALVPKYLGNTYDGIVAAGRSKLPSMMVPVSYQLYPVLASAAFSAGSVNAFWGTYAVGEVKRARDVKMQLISMIVPSIVLGLSIVVAYTLLYGFAGREFMISLANFSTIGGPVIKAPLAWNGVAIAYTMMMVADNFWLQMLIMIGFICAAVVTGVPAWLVTTRELFAWSFDRLIPAKFSEIHERYHTPWWSVIALFVIIEAVFLVYTFFVQYMGAFFTIAWDGALLATTVLCISAACLPLRKSLWDASPVKWKLFGIPVITIGGIIGAFYSGLAVCVYTFTPGVGFGLPATQMLLVLLASPFIAYWIIRAIRKRQGIDLDLIMREIPPE